MPLTNQNPSPKCPNCGDDIERLNYYVSTSENGSASLDLVEIVKWIPAANGVPGHGEPTGKFRWETNDHENDGGDWEEDPSYECQNCGENIYIRNLEIPSDKLEKEKIIKPIEPDDAVESETNIIFSGLKDQDNPQKEFRKNSFSINEIEICICEKCGHLISSQNCNYGDSLIICPECYHQIDVKTNRTLLKEGKFKVKS